MEKNSKIVIIGAGLFGLTTAYQLATEGYQNIIVLDRHTPPVPDGSSNDISRVIRYDYADKDYLELAHEAYTRWSQKSKYKGIFFPTPYILASNTNAYAQKWVKQTSAALTDHNLPWSKLDSAASARKHYPVLSGELAAPGFFGYHHQYAGWADAGKAIRQIRDECLDMGISFLCGPAGTVVGFDTDSQNRIKSAQTLAGTSVEGSYFILTAGAWNTGLVNMYNSALATAQVLGYLRLTDDEMQRYKDLPIYINAATGWFNFPPHEDTKMLKVAVHGWGYTRAPDKAANTAIKANANVSSPPLKPPRERINFTPADGERRLREGLRELLPELAGRPFERTALCWYTDTPTGDFVMDYHPDYANLFLGGGGSGHAFKFFPVLGEYMSRAIHSRLPEHLASKWRFRREFENRKDAFLGDGSRGGPDRRELSHQERAKL